ncbi:mitochondrial ribosomal protein subunit L20-domain-containing protein [Absidia repens]|uniref:Mitochondrial ribosomal protein subunit L20-domain-containing protein n=1 Tax=Absidia repens TaxID=90262 RepID=A0A1X2IAE9_9FUNG|nr:mitochondrial ribosomal protein subunit L20-domain-containing protein [Absidia repens]
MFSQCVRQVRGYATKSKATNRKMTARVPLEHTSLSNGNVFVARQPVVSLEVQATAPAIHRPHERKPELNETQINEIRQLRQQDPETWTRKKLADKFNCSPLFISMVASSPSRQATPPVTESSEKGYRRQLITKNRQKRRELW